MEGFDFNYEKADEFFAAHPLSNIKDAATDPFGGISTSTPWDDALFVREYQPDAISLLPKERTLTNAVQGAQNLLLWYLGISSTALTPINVAGNWYAAMSCTKIGRETYIYPTGDSAYQTTAADWAEKVETIKYLNSSGTTKETVVYGEGATKVIFNLDKANDWYTKVRALLSSADVNDRYEGIRQVVFAVDTCFRCMQKEPANVSEHIATRTSDAYIGITSEKLEVKIPPPAGSFLQFIQSDFNSRHSSGRGRLLVNMYALLEAGGSKAIQGWLAATCMLSIGGTGLGLIDWFFKVVKLSGKTAEYVLGFFNYGQMIISCARLVYWGETSKGQKTWRWARLVVDSALYDFSIEMNKEMTVICALITADCKASTVKEYTQFCRYHTLVTNLEVDASVIASKLIGANLHGKAIGVAAHAVQQEISAQKAQARNRRDYGEENDSATF